MCQCIYCVPTPSRIWNSKSGGTASSLVTAVPQHLTHTGCSSKNCPMGDWMNLNMSGKFSVYRYPQPIDTQFFLFFVVSGKGSENVFNNKTQLLPAWISDIPNYRKDLCIYSDASSRCWCMFFLSKYNSNFSCVPKPHGSGTLNLGVGMSV